MIYDTSSPLFRSFLAAGGGSSAPGPSKTVNRKGAGEKASANKPAMME
eukprot:CAMPEP_0206140006 /NCGR_PEP_ID=MMETSP1473-20131121/7993_1 /ASSEMBLY_ACC=CAM_ASM_001109 /TAXON_ID=1461547 /ORGANISM="Stichococcus sp, Strain RCC1054" /LENGTH=47 /DNA_ID= /DNA_START= /DNA_END= /DNA_ORIENTATION=